MLLCPTACYLPIVYFLFPETKNRTLEELGEIFGDKHVVSHWYGISEKEREQIAHDAMAVTDDGRIVEPAPEEVKALETAHVEQTEIPEKV